MPRPAVQNRQSKIQNVTMLAWTVYISFIGVALLMLLPSELKKTARAVALLTALAGLAIAITGAFQYQLGSGIITIKKVPWIPSLGIDFHLATDGISLTM